VLGTPRLFTNFLMTTMHASDDKSSARSRCKALTVKHVNKATQGQGLCKRSNLRRNPIFRQLSHKRGHWLYDFVFTVLICCNLRRISFTISLSF